MMENQDNNHFKKAGLLCLALCLVFIISWEGYWRMRGFSPTYNDDDSFWAHKRQEVYEAPEKNTVFIGSSRIKFDLDTDLWKEETGENAIQLSMVGTNPRPLLSNLANDEKFKGKLVIDVTEGLFFNTSPGPSSSAIKGIKYYKDITPSQRGGFYINYVLESGLVTLEEKKFSLSNLLKGIDLPNRKGVRGSAQFPFEFELMKESRQNFMLPAFLKDTLLQKRQQQIWAMFGSVDTTAVGVGGDTLKKIFAEIKHDIDKIRNRGGVVIFVRTPASGPFEYATTKVYPRTKYWDQLLTQTQTEGIHYKDDPQASHFTCPEWSHLSPSDALLYTKSLAAELKAKGWFDTNKSVAKF
jgi:hypothetical protein